MLLEKMSIKLTSNSLLLLKISKANVRCLATHWDPKFKKLRAQKIIKVIAMS